MPKYLRWLTIPIVRCTECTPLHEKQPYTLMLSHPCFTVKVVYLGFVSVRGRPCTYNFPSEPVLFISVLSVKSSFRHCFLLQLRCFSAKAKRHNQFILETISFFRATPPNNFSSFKHLQIVHTDRFVTSLEKISCKCPLLFSWCLI